RCLEGMDKGRRRVAPGRLPQPVPRQAMDGRGRMNVAIDMHQHFYREYLAMAVAAGCLPSDTDIEGIVGRLQLDRRPLVSDVSGSASCFQSDMRRHIAKCIGLDPDEPNEMLDALPVPFKAMPNFRKPVAWRYRKFPHAGTWRFTQLEATAEA